MSDHITPEELADLKGKAQRQSSAHATMIKLGQGVGGLAVKNMGMYKDMLAWDDVTEDDHADTVLALIAEVERLRSQLDAADRQIAARTGETAAERLFKVRVKDVTAEREALAATLERVQVEIARLKEQGWVGFRRFDDILAAAPSVSLAHVKADAKAEALRTLAKQVARKEAEWDRQSGRHAEGMSHAAGKIRVYISEQIESGASHE